MSVILTAMIIVTAFLALYWVFYGQRKYNEMLNPPRKTELKAILFDLDGVIIDSFDAWFNVFNDLRKKYKLKDLAKQEFRRRVWGNNVEAEAKAYFKNQNINEVIKNYNNLRNKYSNKTKLLPDAKEVIKQIKKKNIKIAIVTNTFKKQTLDTLKFHGMENYFDVIVTSDDIKKAKPHPDSILKACKKLNIMPDEAMYVGDTKFDYKAGKSAGCFVVGLNTHGDLVISRLKDLLQLL